VRAKFSCAVYSSTICDSQEPQKVPNGGRPREARTTTGMKANTRLARNDTIREGVCE
jgi:hypothetical protein